MIELLCIFMDSNLEFAEGSQPFHIRNTSIQYKTPVNILFVVPWLYNQYWPSGVFLMVYWGFYVQEHLTCDYGLQKGMHS